MYRVSLAVVAAMAIIVQLLVSPLSADEVLEFREDTTAGISQLLDRAGPRKVYLIGDATHGSSQFYRFRQQVSMQLIDSAGARDLVLEMEADEAAQINEWLSSPAAQGEDAEDVLTRSIQHWPRWVWANREVAEFLEWVHTFNATKAPTDRVRLHGMDLKELDNDVSAEYAKLIREDPYAAWNYRARYMAEVLGRIVGNSNRAIVWAHNNHVGDKRADDIRGIDLVSVGQLVRERLGPQNVLIIGTAASEGSYVAAPKWGDRWQVVTMEPALSGSLAHTLSDPAYERSLLFWQSPDERTRWSEPVYHRGIGVISSEGASNHATYVLTRLASRYDAVGFFRQVAAVTPLP